MVREADPASMEVSIVKAREAGGFVELRLDYLSPEHLQPSIVAKWLEQAQAPVVLTLRRRPKAGKIEGS